MTFSKSQSIRRKRGRGGQPTGESGPPLLATAPPSRSAEFGRRGGESAERKRVRGEKHVRWPCVQLAFQRGVKNAANGGSPDKES